MLPAIRSGLEHFPREIAELDREIRHYAAVCGVDLARRHEVEACLHARHDSWLEDQARETLRGLLILRLKVEAEMLEEGLAPPPLIAEGDPF